MIKVAKTALKMGRGHLTVDAVDALYAQLYAIPDDRSQTMGGLSFCLFVSQETAAIL